MARTPTKLSLEDGAILVITTVALLAILVFAAIAIETGIWFVHKAHLQTEADAAALAAGGSFQYPCEAKVEERIDNAVHQYDGTTVANGGYNEQVPLTPTPSQATTYVPKHHELFSLINRPSFVSQPTPDETELAGSPSPCDKNMVDVKLTETDVPSFFPWANPEYINAHARVSIEQETKTGGTVPLVEALPTPNSMKATLVNEKTKEPIKVVDETTKETITEVTLTPSDQDTVWEARNVSVPFTDSNEEATIPIGLRIAMSGGTTAKCEAATCFETEKGDGVAFIRGWRNSGTPGQPATGTPEAPQTTEVTVEPTPVGTGTPCAPVAGQAFSNFISTSTECSVRVKAEDIVFAEGPGAPVITCEDASLWLNSVKLRCPTTKETEAVDGKTWVSEPVTVKPNEGLKPLTLTWKLTKGRKPKGATKGKTKCEEETCEGTLAVQRVNSGAYDSETEETSKSGPIISATVTEAAGEDRDIMSIERGKTENVNIRIEVLSLEDSTGIESKPVELSFSGNHADGYVECGGSNGVPQLEKAIEEGCPTIYETTEENPANCTKAPEPLTCVGSENPGTGKDKAVTGGMEGRVNGGTGKCVNPNHWVSPNTAAEIAGSSDPRLIDTLITSYGGVGTSDTPVRGFALFYVTGWAGDPCDKPPHFKEASNMKKTPAYTYDEEETEEGVLLGHFIHYVNSSPTATGSGECSEDTFGDCVAVLTR